MKIVVKEVREALPATVFFLVLFHLIGLTKAVVLDEDNFSALRATGATIGALIVAKAILVVEALPFVKRMTGSLLRRAAWKTALYAAVVLLFRALEELIPLWSKYRSLGAAAKAMDSEVSWPLFWVLALWIAGGLFLYCLAAELVAAAGKEKVKSLLFASPGAARLD
jgi:hypothetical protein